MTKILNLDAFVEEHEPKKIVWKGEEFEVVGVTGKAYLRFLRMQQNLQRKQRNNDEAAQFELSIEMIILAVPNLEQYRDDLLELPLNQLLKLVEFVSEELGVDTSTVAVDAQGVETSEGE